MKIFLNALILCLITLSASGQSVDIEKLEQSLIPIEHLYDAKESFSGFRLIGLGEATHGTSEFFSIKAEFIKYLILNEGFNTIIFEGSYSNSKSINKYITEGEGNVYHAIIDLGPWCWYTKEVLELVEWLKDYNSNKQPTEKVQFYGCDMQILKFTIDALTTYINNLGILENDLQAKLESVKALTSYRKLNKEQSQLIQDLLGELKLVFSDPKTQAHIDPASYHNLRILEQWFERITTKKDQPNKRDEFMAENVQFILSLNENNKAVVWAHNTHIARNKDMNQRLIPMGYHLASRYGENYFAIGFGFNSGVFNTTNGNERTVTVGNADENSSDFQFSKSALPTFFLNVRDLDTHVPLIHEKSKSRNVGQTYYPKGSYRYHVISESYDGVIFVRETTASELLDFNLIK